MSYLNMGQNSISVYLISGEEKTIHLGRGTDTVTDRYLDLSPDRTMKFRLLPSTAILITQTDGKVLKYPIKVHSVKQFNNKKMFANIRSFKIFGLGTSSIVDVIGGG